jgi:NCAIR mutase (PurE)-related protein
MDTEKTEKETQAIYKWLYEIMEKVKSGEMSIEQASRELSILPYEDLNFANVDHHRHIRTGFPEVVFGEGKTVEQILAIVERLVTHSDRVLVTRASPEAFQAVSRRITDSQYNPVSRTIVINRQKDKTLIPGIVLVAGGTADMPVAEESAVTAELMGNQVEKVFDVGVAGLHRLLDRLPILRRANVLIVVAGMEGALASVVGGLVSSPIIAVPTSIGYGASFGGIAPLLTMLNSCAPGIAVVNIDNGFGAGYMAGLINRKKNEDADG